MHQAAAGRYLAAAVDVETEAEEYDPWVPVDGSSPSRSGDEADTESRADCHSRHPGLVLICRE
jgi:hypothetical protein